MTKRSDKNLIVGLDIGTSKVVTIVAEVNVDGSIEIIGMGEHASRGMKKGVVVQVRAVPHFKFHVMVCRYIIPR